MSKRTAQKAIPEVLQRKARQDRTLPIGMPALRGAARVERVVQQARRLVMNHSAETLLAAAIGD